MTTRLILIRHAKSGWDDPTLDDHDRPLAPRGIAAAQDVGRWLSAQGVQPSLALCSTAKRTVETLGLIVDDWAEKPVTHYVPDLYLASAPTLLRVLRHANATDVMMIGHNPGITDFAVMLAAAPVKHPRWTDHPTAAVTILQFDAETSRAVDFGTGSVVAFVCPCDIQK